MKNKLIKRFLITAACVLSLALSVTTAFALTESSSVVSPFWQSDGSVYTFVAVSHTSLNSMNSEIGVIVSALKNDGSSFGSTQFTVGENTTSRVFVVATNHSSINNLTVTGSKDIFIAGTTNFASGQLNFTPRATNPYQVNFSGPQGLTRIRDITMLSFWGSIVVPGTNTGFAMEFIGDTHDSIFATMSGIANSLGGIAVGVN